MAWAWTSVHAVMLARASVKGAAIGSRHGSEPHRSRSSSRSGVASLEFCDGPGRCREFSRAMRFKAPASPRHGPPPRRVRSPSLCGNGPPRPGHGLAWRPGSSRALRSRERGRHRPGPPPTRARRRPRYSAMFPPAPPGREQMPKPRAAPLSPQPRQAIPGPLTTSGSISRGFRHAAPPVETNHRALVIRRCTALVCVEQKRVHLPMIRAN